jgi:hypothetical protein
MLGKQGPALTVSIQRIGLPILLVLCAAGLAMPFYNLRETGNVFRTPYQVHEETYAMAPVFLWQSPRPEPVYHHEDLRNFHTTCNLSLYHLEHSIFDFLLKSFLLLRTFALYFFNVFAKPMGTLCADLIWLFYVRDAPPGCLGGALSSPHHRAELLFHCERDAIMALEPKNWRRAHVMDRSVLSSPDGIDVGL